METIRTYENINRNDSELSFGISRMEDIYERNVGEVNFPHRHNYYTILLVKKASGEHIIDFNNYPLTDKQVHFIMPGQVHHVMEKEKSFGYSMVFSTDFLLENNISFSFIEDLNIFSECGKNPPIPLNDDKLVELVNFCEEIIKLNESDLKFKTQAIGAYLKLFLITSNNLCTLPQPFNQEFGPNESGKHILKNFKVLIESHHSEKHSTSDYAEILNITPDHLNRTIKSLTGKTAKDHIQSRIIVSAKRMLFFSDLSNKEIGYNLGFSEPSNFSAFFKKHTGKSPSNFKKATNIGFL